MPNPFPTPPPLLSGVSSTDPLLNYSPAAGDPPPSAPPCPTMPQTGPPCVLTVQYNNARQDASIYENALTVGSVMGAMAGKSIFKVDKSGLPIPYGTNPPFPTNPVYAQPLYVAGLTVGAGTYNVLYVAALNGEVYAYSADHASVSSTSECVTVGTNGCLWFRDETNSPGMRGLKHNCDTGAGPGNSVVGPAIPGYLEFAGTISTPVIEAKSAAAAIYVTNLCAKTDASEHWYLNALSLTSGATLGVTEITYNTIVSSPNGPQQAFAPASQLQRPGLLLASSTAAGVCSSPPCRSVIASFGTAVDETTMQYQGWMFAYNGNSPSTLSSQTPAPYTTECYYPPETTGRPAACDPLDAEYPFNQCGQGGGVWMFSRGPAANTVGNVFAVSGNGGFDYCPTCAHQCIPTGAMTGYTDEGESVLNIQMSSVWNYTGTPPAPLYPSDYFLPYKVPSYLTGYSTPTDCPTPCTYFQVLNDYDWDMGNAGTMLFDDFYQQPGGDLEPGTALVMTASKRGDGYVMLQSDLGEFTTTDSGAVATFNLGQTTGNLLCTLGGTGQGMGQCDQVVTPAYWNPPGSSTMGGFLAVWPWHETLASYRWTAAGGGGTPYSFNLASTTTSPLPLGKSAGYAGGTLAITVNTADITGDAIVWATVFPVTCTNVAGDPYSGSGRECPGYLLAYSLTSSRRPSVSPRQSTDVSTPPRSVSTTALLCSTI